MHDLLSGLRAAAEPTRLRLLSLCADTELTVTELTRILGQSQPRVSRHLKLLVDARLLERFREGSWAFYRLARRGSAGKLAQYLVSLLPGDDPGLILDRSRLDEIRAERDAEARAYFDQNAAEWREIRALHIDELEVERKLLERVGPAPIGDFIDIGTGTGRLLELLSHQVEQGIGIDLSREMMAIARANLAAAGLKHCSVRQGDLYQLPFASRSVDLVTVHQVLHYLEEPSRAVMEMGRILRAEGRLMIVDFAPHTLEELRIDHAHRRLGFGDQEVALWLRQAGLEVDYIDHLLGGRLGVAIWTAHRPIMPEVSTAPLVPTRQKERV